MEVLSVRSNLSNDLLPIRGLANTEYLWLERVENFHANNFSRVFSLVFPYKIFGRNSAYTLDWQLSILYCARLWKHDFVLDFYALLLSVVQDGLHAIYALGQLRRPDFSSRDAGGVLGAYLGNFDQFLRADCATCWNARVNRTFVALLGKLLHTLNRMLGRTFRILYVQENCLSTCMR